MGMGIYFSLHRILDKIKNNEIHNYEETMNEISKQVPTFENNDYWKCIGYRLYFYKIFNTDPPSLEEVKNVNSLTKKMTKRYITKTNHIFETIKQLKSEGINYELDKYLEDGKEYCVTWSTSNLKDGWYNSISDISELNFDFEEFAKNNKRLIV